jgi:predicted metal-dependent hydrolase
VQNVWILRSRRKSIAIEIQRDGKILVRAPLHAAQTRIEALLIEKKAWIEAKLALIGQIQAQVPVHSFQPGDTFPYLGVWYALKLVERSRPILLLDGTFQLSKSAQPAAREAFEAWYRREAARLFQERVAFWSAATGLTPSRLRLSSARSRWGSCSSSGNINLAWRLVMAPLEVIDYVVVHELAHLKVKNHSKTFWNLVQIHMPNYAAHRKWLKDHGLRLEL